MKFRTIKIGKRDAEVNRRVLTFGSDFNILPDAARHSSSTWTDVGQMPSNEEEQRRLEEARRKAEEEEERRLEEEVERQTESLRRARGKKKVPAEDQQKRKEEEQRKAEEQRKREEEERRRREEEQRRKADDEARRQRDEERRRREEEERRKREEEDRKRREEEERRQGEEEERRRREDEEKQRQEELERKRKEQDEQLVVENALSNARTYLEQKDFDQALTEIGKLLSVNPMHAEALTLDEEIRKGKSEAEAEKASVAQPVVEAPKEEQPPVGAPLEPVEQIPAVEEPKKPPAPKKPFPKGLVIGAVVVVLAIVIGIVVYKVSHSLLEGKRYIAVLPFSSQSNTEEERLLGTAIASDVATLLAYFPDARVMDPTSAMLLQRRSRDPRAEANKLTFPHTLSGSITVSESKIVLSLSLVDSTGSAMWSGNLEKSRSNLTEITGELVRIVADAFSLDIPETMGAAAGNKRTTNADAYAAYLHGLELQQENTALSTKTAVSMFQQATSQDPGFANAYASMAHSLYHTYDAGWSADEGLLTQAQTLATKALGLNASLASANAVVGGVAALQTRYPEALSALGTAITTMPSNVEANRVAGIVYAIGGNEAKAMEHLAAAYELAPLNTDVLTTAGLVYEHFGKPKDAIGFFDQALPLISDTSTYLAETAGNTLVASYEYDRAIALYERRVATLPRNFIDQYKLARAYQLSAKDAAVWSKAFEKTISLAQQEVQQNPQNALAVAYLGLAYSRFGRFPEGEENGKKAVQMAPENPTIRYKLADIYSIQKKKDEAIATLREAIAKRYALQEIIDLDLFNVADEPEFSETVTKAIQ